MVKLLLSGSFALAAAVAMLVASTSAPAATAFAQSTVAGQKPKADPTRDLYVANCQMCHGEDGLGLMPEMAFVGRTWKTKTAAEAAKVITTGVPGTVMLPFEGRLTKEQILALARYVRALDTPEARKKK